MIKLKSLFRRGQTPSGSASSKYNAGQPQQPTPADEPVPGVNSAATSSSVAPLKGSSSTSNIDGLGLSKSDRKKQKDFGSRDNLERKDYKSSKDRLVDNLRGHGKSKSAAKEAKKQSKQELSAAAQMSLVQQQQSPQVSGSVVAQQNSQAAYEHQRPAYGIVDASLVKELTEINFDGPHSDAKSIQLQELRSQLDQVSAEKKVIEDQMSLFRAEATALRNEMSKMKVSGIGFISSIDCKSLTRLTYLLLHCQSSHESFAQEVQRLSDENDSLRSHLRDVVQSPLSDAEKQKIIDSQRLHSSAPASIAVPNVSV